jgi:hypothetical protein
MTPEEEEIEERVGRKRLKERYARSQRPIQTPKQIYEDILANVLRNTPALTREEAEAMLAHYL